MTRSVHEVVRREPSSVTGEVIRRVEMNQGKCGGKHESKKVGLLKHKWILSVQILL